MTTPRTVLHIGLLTLVVIWAASATSSRLRAQFRTDTTLVVVDAAVTGVDGAVVRNLTAADFELLVDGTPTPIEQFRLQTPQTRLRPRHARRRGLERSGARRRIALVIDELNLGTRSTLQARRLAVEFIQNTLQPHDYATVLRTGRTSALLFSNDRDRLAGLAREASSRGGSAQGGTVDVAAAAETDASRQASADVDREARMAFAVRSDRRPQDGPGRG
jgi:VWFA-related protein